MEKLEKHFKLNINGCCNPDCVIQGDKYRFTVLTAQMLRMEYSETGIFEDRPTTVVWNRNFEHPKFTVRDTENCLEIDTEYFHVVYDKKKFGPNHLYIDIKYAFTNYGGRWYYGQTVYGDPPREHNLKGTARTLDRCDGQWYKGANTLERMKATGGKINRCDGDVDLGRGLCDTSGRTFFDDSQSPIIDENGWVQPRKTNEFDCYFFGYGRDYFGAIRDFYKLSGPVPMLPKYALGNWWSRYWKYTEESYKNLLTRFEAMDIPFSVVVMDMDWHIVDVPEKYGKGWTGYTWNKKYFPEPKRFLDWLHEHNYRITLNLHPADGIQAYEEKYSEMANAMGIDPNSEYPIHFDFTNIEFITAYFKYLHHPEEERGVDFWWMDWQQGNVSAVEGLDPLWMLNHYHHYDLKRNGKRGLMLSRYSGLGSHRYPIGFSGDVHVTWNSLEYQPYFTATAANVGYTWWSHDIGGHMNGIKDNELYIRWLQYGIFSPINRLHSNCNPFCGKEPWRYPKPYDEIAEKTLRLRHQLLPYIYTMNYECHEKLKPAIVPVYYYYSMIPDAYEYRNQYFFGTELMIQPMVHPTDPETGMTAEHTWIPAGIWTDIYSGRIYHGGKKGKHAVLCRPIDQEGVLAKAGGIIPLAKHVPHNNSIANPETLEVYVFPGGNNEYILFEDSGEGFSYKKGQRLDTKFALSWSNDRAIFTVEPKGDFSVIPQIRKYNIHFRGFGNHLKIQASEKYESVYELKNQTLTLTCLETDPRRKIQITLSGQLTATNDNLTQQAFDFLDRIQGSITMKKALYQCFENASSKEEIITGIMALEPPKAWQQALLEIISC